MRTFTPTTAPDLSLTRIGYGAMRLPGPGVWGPPAGRQNALDVAASHWMPSIL